jgi:hypothetical protein
MYKLGYQVWKNFEKRCVTNCSAQTTASRRIPGKPRRRLAQVISLCSQALQSLKDVLDLDRLLELRKRRRRQSDPLLFCGGSIRIAQHAAFNDADGMPGCRQSSHLPNGATPWQRKSVTLEFLHRSDQKRLWR